MKIEISTAFFIIVTLSYLVGVLFDTYREISGGMWGIGKRKWEFGLVGYFLIVAYIIFVLIWGGIFWW